MVLSLLACATPDVRPPRGDFHAQVDETQIPTVTRVHWDLEGVHRVEYGLEVLDRHTADTDTADITIALHAGTWWVRAHTAMPSGEERVSHTVEVEVGATPGPLAALQLLRSEPGAEMRHHWLLLNQYEPESEWSWAAVIDGQAAYRWYLPTPPGALKIHRVRPDPGGDGIWWAGYHWWREEDLGTLVHTAWDGTERGRWAAEEEHHDFTLHDDGSVAWLSWVYRDAPMPGADGPTATDAIRTMVPGEETQIAFSMLEDYPAEPAVPCRHALRMQYLPGWSEWSHSNSLIWEPTEDAWWVMARYLDQLIAIDRPTGTLKWRLGGQGSDFEFEGRPFDHAHFSEGWPGGVLLFDNRDHDDDPVSRVVEYALEDGVAREVWSYEQPDGEHVGFLGDARRLPGGNRLVVWSSIGLIEEVTPSGEVVWAAQSTDVVGRVTVVPVGLQ